MSLTATTALVGHDARVRIFSVEEELPFAGHPTLGTAVALRGASGAAGVALELGVGRVPVRIEERPGQPAFGEMSQIDPVFGAVHDPAAVVAAVLGVGAAELDPELPVQLVSTGLLYLIVPFRSLAALQRVRLDVARAETWLAGHGGRHFFLVARQVVDPAARLHARMIFGGGEDPATGSASGCAAAWMVAHGVARPEERVLIEQGLEARRPSQLFVRASRTGDRVHGVRVGGHAVEVLRGEVAL